MPCSVSLQKVHFSEEAACFFASVLLVPLPRLGERCRGSSGGDESESAPWDVWWFHSQEEPGWQCQDQASARPPLGSLPAAGASRKELLINQIPSKGDAWRNIYKYAYGQTQVFVLAAQNIEIYAVPQYRELQRMETTFWDVTQTRKQVNIWSAKDLGTETTVSSIL